jgi:hypothetical protein
MRKVAVFMHVLFVPFTARFIGCCYCDSFFHVEKLVSMVSICQFSFVFDIEMRPFRVKAVSLTLF